MGSTASQTGHTSTRRIAGLQKNLLDRSIEAYVLSLETINRLSITSRVETFAYLICNAWELLLKARILREAGERTAINYPPEEGKRPRTLSLRDCLKKTLKDNDLVRLNIEWVEELRDEATHQRPGQDSPVSADGLGGDFRLQQL